MIRLLAPAQYEEALHFLTREDSRTTLLFQRLHDLATAPPEVQEHWDCLATLSIRRDLTGVVLVNKQAGSWLVHGKESAWAYLPNLSELQAYSLTRLQGERMSVDLLLRRRPVAERRLDRWYDEVFYEIGSRDLKVEPDAECRLARPEDIPQLQAHERMYRLERGGGGSSDWDKLVDARLVYVSERDGQLIASLKQYAENERRCEFGGLFTVPVVRGHGVAPRLLAAFCRDVFRKGKLACLYTDADNAAAIRAYDKVGFNARGSIKIAYFR